MQLVEAEGVARGVCACIRGTNFVDLSCYVTSCLSGISEHRDGNGEAARNDDRDGSDDWASRPGPLKVVAPVDTLDPSPMSLPSHTFARPVSATPDADWHERRQAVAVVTVGTNGKRRIRHEIALCSLHRVDERKKRDQ